MKLNLVQGYVHKQIGPAKVEKLKSRQKFNLNPWKSKEFPSSFIRQRQCKNEKLEKKFEAHSVVYYNRRSNFSTFQHIAKRLPKYLILWAKMGKFLKWNIDWISKRKIQFTQFLRRHAFLELPKRRSSFRHGLKVSGRLKHTKYETW